MLRYLTLMFLTSCSTVGTGYSPRCPNPKWEGRQDAITHLDLTTFDHARSRCQQLYPKSPCVVVFRRNPKNDYQVTCGKESK